MSQNASDSQPREMKTRSENSDALLKMHDMFSHRTFHKILLRKTHYVTVNFTFLSRTQSYFNSNDNTVKC